MCLVTAAEFLANPMKYLQLAKNETVSVQDDNLFFDITYRKEKYENPSPSGDTWWDIPENRNEIERRFKDMDDGKTQFVHLSREELRKVMGL